MIKTIIFDIDGVIVSTKKLHEIAIICALQKFGYQITHEQHNKELDGLPTKIKLAKLNIPPEQHETISNLKQQFTFSQAEQYIKFNHDIANMFTQLTKEGYNLAIASNAIKRFCELVVLLMKLEVKLIMSNEDAKPKPDPEMYLKAMHHFNTTGEQTLICEDSKVGLSAAYKSGAYVLYIPDPSYLNYQFVKRFLGVL